MQTLKPNRVNAGLGFLRGKTTLRKLERPRSKRAVAAPRTPDPLEMESSQVPSGDQERRARCEAIMGYQFHSQSLLAEALTTKNNMNKRLAIIGDSVISTFMAERWYQWAGKSLTGRNWSRVHSGALSNRSLAAAGRSLGLDRCVRGMKSSDGRPSRVARPMADTVEALIGAMWLDSNFNRSFMLALISRFGLTHGVLLAEWRPTDLATSMALPTAFFQGNGPEYERPFFTSLPTELYIHIRSTEPSICLMRRLHAGQRQTHTLKRLIWKDPDQNKATDVGSHRQVTVHEGRPGAEMETRHDPEHGETLLEGKEVVSSTALSETTVDEQKDSSDELAPPSRPKRGNARRREMKAAKALRKQHKAEQRAERRAQRMQSWHAKRARSHPEPALPPPEQNLVGVGAGNAEQVAFTANRAEIKKAKEPATQSGSTGMWAGLKTLFLGPEATRSESIPSVQSPANNESDAATVGPAGRPSRKSTEPRPKSRAKAPRPKSRTKATRPKKKARDSKKKQRRSAQRNLAPPPPEQDQLHNFEARLQSLMARTRDATDPFVHDGSTGPRAMPSARRGLVVRRL